jgi:hypothetical protein
MGNKSRDLEDNIYEPGHVKRSRSCSGCPTQDVITLEERGEGLIGRRTLVRKIMEVTR